MGKNVSDTLVVLLSGKHESWVYNELINALAAVGVLRALKDFIRQRGTHCRRCAQGTY